MTTNSQPLVLATLLMLTSLTATAESPHIQQSQQQLEKAVENLSTGQLEEAKKDLHQAKQHEIMHEAEHPLHVNPNDKAEMTRSEHAGKIIQDINRADQAVSDGDAKQAEEAIEDANVHLKHHQ